MIEKYWNNYREEQTNLNEKMTFKKALIYTLFDSIFNGIWWGIGIGIAWAFTNIFAISIIKQLGEKVCPLLK